MKNNGVSSLVDQLFATDVEWCHHSKLGKRSHRHHCHGQG